MLKKIGLLVNVVLPVGCDACECCLRFSCVRSCSEKYGTTSDDRQEEVVRLLKVIQAGCSRYPQSAALFLDQLATMVTCITLLGKIEVYGVLLQIVVFFSVGY